MGANRIQVRIARRPAALVAATGLALALAIVPATASADVELAPVPVEADPEPATRDARELTDVEQALGRDLDREYQHYLKTRGERHSSYAWYKYKEGRDARESGALMAGLAAPLIFCASAGIALGVFQPWAWQECTDSDADQQNFCELGQFPLEAGFVLVVAIGAAGTGLTLGFGIRRYRRGRFQEEAMRPLLGRKYSAVDNRPTWAVAPLVTTRGPAGLALGGRF